MVNNKLSIIILSFVILGFTNCRNKSSSSSVVRDDFKKYYDRYSVEGSFVLYDQNKDQYIFYNKDQIKQSYTPASTFKICNSLIGLETGVVDDENYVIPWDSIVRNPVWDKDHDLKTAFANSTVWYYQEVARRVGARQMKLWIDSAHYGNRDTSGGIDLFWLTGGLRITPEQQIDFLKRLYHHELPFSKRSMDIVKNIMIVKDSADCVIRAKTGWGSQDSIDIGWFVGYLETKENVYYFANCVQIDGKKLYDVQNAIRFDQSRTEIVYSIVDDLGIIQLK